MDYTSRLELSYYHTVAAINEEHHIYLVQHQTTNKFYVKKELSVYNLDVYNEMKRNPIPGTPTLHLLYEEDGVLTIIEDYIVGKTLEELLSEKGAFSEGMAIRYLLRICDIVETMHKCIPPIIHRDIKPSNIQISIEDTIYLLDMNAARSNIVKNEDTVLLGTKGYAAPEQYGFGSSDAKTDIYALGMLLNTMLWGEFNQSTFPNSKLTRIINKCTQMDPNNRYSNIAELKAALQSVPKISLWWRKHGYYFPPGFRTGNIAHMLIAAFCYYMTFYICLTLQVKDTYGAALNFERLIVLICFLLCIIVSTNYLGFQQKFPLCKSKYIIVRIFGVILADLAILFSGLLFLTFTLQLFT